MRSSFSMRRLNYRFQEFTKHHWINDETRALWEPRIGKVCACLVELEWRSILEGVRVCALRVVAPREFEVLSGTLARHGLVVDALEKIAAQDGYASSRRAARAGEPFRYWCVIGRPGDIQQMKAAQLIGDDQAVGRLLGYPPCCTVFYQNVWVKDGFIDTTWPMAHNATRKRSITRTHVEIPAVSKCSILLRWLGLRIVFHLPCSFDCQPTVKLADKFIEIARAAGYHQEMDWLEEMLSWPVEWSALYGLAEITTPVGTTFTVTDVTDEKYRVSYNGTS